MPFLLHLSQSQTLCSYNTIVLMFPKHRHAAMEHRRGELEYSATLDKRICPSCDAEQSYDEVVDTMKFARTSQSDPIYDWTMSSVFCFGTQVREGRKFCPNCNVEYRKPRTWAAVRQVTSNVFAR